MVGEVGGGEDPSEGDVDDRGHSVPGDLAAHRLEDPGGFGGETGSTPDQDQSVEEIAMADGRPQSHEPSEPVSNEGRRVRVEAFGVQQGSNRIGESVDIGFTPGRAVKTWEPDLG